MSLQALLEDVNRQADSLNYLVVTKVLGTFSPNKFKVAINYPPCSCRYPLYIDRFRSLLRAYTTIKLKIYYIKRDFMSGRHSDGCRREEWEFHYSDVPIKYRKLFNEVESLRKELKKIWPCEACMHMYNPTGRKY